MELFTMETGDLIETSRLLNLAIAKEDSFRTHSIKGDFYSRIGWYDEAEEEFKQALYYEENIETMNYCMYVELMLKHTFLAIELGEKIRSRKDEAPEGMWEAVAENLTRVYINEHEFEAAELLIKECEKEENKEHLWFDDMREFLDTKKKQEK